MVVNDQMEIFLRGIEVIWKTLTRNYDDAF